jgi:hypothetical protein
MNFADTIPVAVLGVEFASEAAHVAFRIGRSELPMIVMILETV